jgi:hypothetical protein
MLSQLRHEILKLKTENSSLRADLEKQKQFQIELESNYHGAVNQLREENMQLVEQLEEFKKRQLPPDNSVHVIICRFCQFPISIFHIITHFSDLSFSNT